MTTDEALAWVGELNDHMDCYCYDTLTTLAAEVRRLRELVLSAKPLVGHLSAWGTTREMRLADTWLKAALEPDDDR